MISFPLFHWEIGGSRPCRPPKGWQSLSQQLGPHVGCGEEPGALHRLLDGSQALG